MTTLNLNEEDSFSYLLYNLSIQLEGGFKMENKYRIKDDYVRAINKFHMENVFDYTVECIN